MKCDGDDRQIKPCTAAPSNFPAKLLPLMSCIKLSSICKECHILPKRDTLWPPTIYAILHAQPPDAPVGSDKLDSIFRWQ